MIFIVETRLIASLQTPPSREIYFHVFVCSTMMYGRDDVHIVSTLLQETLCLNTYLFLFQIIWQKLKECIAAESHAEGFQGNHLVGSNIS